MTKSFNINTFSVLNLALLTLGCCLFWQYGISWDEETSRLATGQAFIDFIFSGDQKALLANNEKYHGPAFEILLLFIEKAFGLTSMKSIYLMRHFCTHFVFIIAAVMLFKLCVKLFHSNWFGLICVLILYTSPRLFADSFYNSKDLVCTSIYAISFYTAILWMEKRNMKYLILHAFICGFLIAIRLTGIILIPLSLLFYTISIPEFSFKKIFSKQVIVPLITYGLLAYGFLILCWPVLWINPVKHLFLAYTEMSNYHWVGEVLYRGKYIYSNQLPLFYPIRWIIISTPIPYLFLFVIGVLLFLFDLFRKNTPNKIFFAFIFMAFALPLLSILIVHPVLYDAWRHLFFLYAPMIIFMVYALFRITEILQNHFHAKYSSKIVGLLFFAHFSWMLFRMISLHPYQNVYFNRFAGKDLGFTQTRYDMDYWGLACRESLEHILKTDPSDSITVLYAYDPIFLNSYLLSEKDRKRLVFQDRKDLPKYRVNIHRFRAENYAGYKNYFQVKREGGVINTVMIRIDK